MVGENRPTADGLVQRGIHSRRSDLDRLDAQSVKHFRLSGRTQVIGTGESSVNVTFPVTFIGRPAFSFGSELAGNQIAELSGGQLPSANCMVADWTRNERITGVHNYTGATLIIVTKYNPRYLWVHWHVEGKAFQNPIYGLQTSDPLEQ